MGRGLIAAAVAASVLAWAPAAQAACWPEPSNSTRKSDRFVVHNAADADADALLGILEEARVFHTGTLGMPDMPTDTCDEANKLDVYVSDLPEGTDGETAAYHGDVNGGSASFVRLDIGSVRNRAVVSHELFHVLQNAIWVKEQPALREATAEWAASRFAGARQPTGFERYPGQPLDCGGTCAYGQWPFYEHLAERFGNGVVRAIHEQAAVKAATNSASPMLDGLDTVLSERGTTLSAELAAFGGRTLTGAFAFGPLQGALGRADGTVIIGQSDPPPVGLALNHLSTNVVAFAGEPSLACQRLPLALRVALPAGAAGATPAFAQDGNPAQPLAIEGGVASYNGEWDTCGSTGRLSVVHGGRAPDGAGFLITASLARPAPPAAVLPPIARATLKLTVPRRVRLRRGVLRFTVQVPRAGRLTVRVDTKPRVRRVVLLRAGKQTVKVTIPRKAKLARKGNRLSLSYADPAAAKPVTASAKVVLRRR